MGPSTFTNIAVRAMEKLHLSKKKDKKVSSLTISSPIEGSFKHQESHMPTVIPDDDVSFEREYLPEPHADTTSHRRRASSTLIPSCPVATPISSSSPRC